MRVALSIAKRKTFANLQDIAEFLDGVLDNELIEKLTMMFQMSTLPAHLEFQETEGKTPWLPMDYVVGALLRQYRAAETGADEGDVATWSN